MGVFEDYVYTYKDLENAYNATGIPDYEQYVYDNPDLLNAYNQSGPKDFGAYVRSYGDLLDAYRKSGSKNIDQWGRNHWNQYGSKEGRTVPSNPTQSVNDWGRDHWNQYGSKEGRELPKYYKQNADEWGQQHWNSSGKNEDRILPGAKISINNEGKAFISAPNAIGSQARNKYDQLVNSFNNAQDGTYKDLMQSLKVRLGDIGFNDLINNNGEMTLSAVYQKKIAPWDASKGAQPPTGGFDASYYREFTQGGVDAENSWDAAQEGVNTGYYDEDGNPYLLPDLDITGRYSFDSYMHWHYTTQGKAAGYRGNEEQYADLADAYEEYLTDAEYEMYRDKVLGGGEETILGKKVGAELSAKEKQIQQQFGSLTTDSLKKAAGELLKAKRQERDLEFYKGLEGFDEVLSINETIANSLLGDSGIGGILGFVTNPVKAQESLEKSLASATGVPTFNGVTYNWQKWFEEQLAGNYEKGITVQDPLDPNKTYTLDAEFAKRYIDEYLKPRFDSSKSMSEFISTLELQQQDKNVFEVQTALAKLRDIGEIRAQAYLDDVYGRDPLNFNVDFYMNPTGNFEAGDPKISKYEEQRNQVANDWETAKRNSSSVVPGTNWTWDQWAYYYGLNINDRNQFAQLHYQVLGASKGFDPAKDVLTLKDASDYISTKILPEIASKDIDLADVNFLQFVTPEEFADSVIEGVSPETNKEEWDKMLATIGIAGEGMGINEVKQYIADQFRTGNAVNIRQSIKYLNEKGKTPTQKDLGVDYIQRAEDAKSTTSPYATTLYKIFKDAGYQGNEDDFYGSFMTDVDKGEMQLLEQGASQKGLQLGGAYAGLTSDDPFQALSSMTGLFGDTSSTTKTSTDSTKTGSVSSGSSYFKLLDDEEEPTKTKSAQKILGEFTSLFKGFT
jgi:hypothetical protein